MVCVVCVLVFFFFVCAFDMCVHVVCGLCVVFGVFVLFVVIDRLVLLVPFAVFVVYVAFVTCVVLLVCCLFYVWVYVCFRSLLSCVVIVCALRSLCYLYSWCSCYYCNYCAVLCVRD